MSTVRTLLALVAIFTILGICALAVAHKITAPCGLIAVDGQPAVVTDETCEATP